MINFEDFSKVELRVGKIKEVTRIENSEKLLKLQVDLGEEIRQVLAGIGKVYEPENLIGKQIVVVANLEPRVMMGEESQGMLLAASSSNGPVILSPETEVESGAKIS